MVIPKIEIFDGDKRREEENERFIRLTKFFFKHLFLPTLLFIGIIILTKSGPMAFFGAIIIGLFISFRKKIFKKKLIKKIKKNRKKFFSILIVFVIILSIFLVYKYVSFLPKQIIENNLDSKYEKMCLEVCSKGLDKETKGDFYGKGYIYISDEINKRLTCNCKDSLPYNLILSN